MSKTIVGTVRIKQSCIQLLRENLDRISVLFSAILSEKCFSQDKSSDQTVFEVLINAPDNSERSLSPDFVTRLQVGYKKITC